MKCYLERFCEKETELLYYWMMDPDDQNLFSSTININGESLFRNWLQENMIMGFHDFFMIKNEENHSIGYVHNYDYSEVDGFCYICVYIAKEFRNTGIGGVAAIKFMKLLFEMYPLRKIYLTVYGYTLQSLNSNRKAGFTEEGKLKQAKFLNGVYYDIHYLSMSRTVFNKTLRKLVSSRE